MVQLEHFVAIEAAQIQSQEELVQCYKGTDTSRGKLLEEGGSCLELRLENFLDRPQLQSRYAILNPQKATSDSVPLVVLSSAPFEMARLHHPLYIKMQADAREPLRLKGPLAHPVRTGKSCTGFMIDFRDISMFSMS